MSAETIRLRGVVQGVGVRPTVALLARRLELAGFVRNDAEGVLVALRGPQAGRDAFLAELLAGLPPLARVVSIERRAAPELLGALGGGFRIERSQGGAPRTAVSPDAAPCRGCRREIFDPAERRYRYPFTSCTHCGPRFSIVTGIPYDRARTTMAGFPLCAACQAEYQDPGDRRYHAEPIACPACGPRVWLRRADGSAQPGGAPFIGSAQPGGAPYIDERRSAALRAIDAVEAAAALLRDGAIVAVKGLGGYHLCCDATSDAAVQQLRRRKRRPSKPLALLAQDLRMIERHCAVEPAEQAALLAPEAPIVLLRRREVAPRSVAGAVAGAVAPGQRTLGFMLPPTPLHDLLVAGVGRPIVCTSGNLSEEPPCTDPDEAQARLGGIADWFLHHDRPIAQRVDDSVARLMDGAVRVLRRARGHAPAPLPLPPGFDGAPRVLAAGAQWKGSLCLSQDGHAVLSPHLGDLDDALTFAEWERACAALSALHQHRPQAVAVDRHPDYRSARAGRALAAAAGVPVVEIQHHHAHVAACLAEHGVPRAAGPVLGIALDGLGLGDDGELWGGELLIADYAAYERVGALKPVALLGGDRAAVEPWRSLYAHLRAERSWDELLADHGDVEAVRYLLAKPRALLEQVLADRRLSPRASSCGRLFDAVAAAVGLHRERIDHEGQAAIALEQAVTDAALEQAVTEVGQGAGYLIAATSMEGGAGLSYLEPLGLWRALLCDLGGGVPVAVIAARFHVALAEALVLLAVRLCAARPGLDTAALCGGVFQNRVLLERVAAGLRAAGLRVLVPRAVPTGDGGLALGQAVIAAARLLGGAPRSS